MNCLEFVNLSEVEPAEFLSILNKKTTREHLIEHEIFDVDKVRKWIQQKIQVDSTQGCKVRAITINKQLAGWCGIQLEEGKYEIAIVIDDSYRGQGVSVFSELMSWAVELGHKTIYIHFLHTRPKYKFLQKMSRNVYESELLGDRFTTYELEVNQVPSEASQRKQ